ncbi:MAG: NAD(P)-binding domain-containing protein [Aestuariivita sp.]|nr:NAD(P)-binding domain-containing protein [Aestuariivita sp.]
MSAPFISFSEAEAVIDWNELTEALKEGHKFPKAKIGDTFLYRNEDTFLVRSAWIDGIGLVTKSATVFPQNSAKGSPVINGAVNLFCDKSGTLEALIDFHAITKFKTASDSLLAALNLARKDAKIILIIGAGTVGKSLIEAFGVGFPDAKIIVWNRTSDSAERLITKYPNVNITTDLKTSVRKADIILTATMTSESIVKGDWLRPGQHLNLIGAYRLDMRETDDLALQRGQIYVDSFDTTIGHIGEIESPLKTGAISKSDIIADFYSLDRFKRSTPETITVFKNGGGAHLDLITAKYIWDRWRIKN